MNGAPEGLAGPEPERDDRSPSGPDTTPSPPPDDHRDRTSDVDADVREIKREPVADPDRPRSPSPVPMLRLNVALAADPAANPDAKDLKNLSAAEAALEEKQSHQQHALNMAIAAAPSLMARKPALPGVLKGPELGLPVELAPRVPMFVCGPCGIRFSSASTLEAHQTYYCSHRKDADEAGGGAGGGPGSSSGVAGSVPGGPGTGQAGGKNAHPGGDGTGEPPAKALKTGKQYACSQCSYSADKKVSLNRHMRMHQSSPSPSPVGPIVNGDDGIALAGHHHVQQQQQQQQQLQLIQAQAVAAAAAVLHQQQQAQQQGQPQQGPAPQVDRYCSDCDIRFSSTKTYRAHKQHYCSSRHREGQQSNNSTPKPTTQKSGSQSPPDVPKTPPVAASQQPFLALPTNPIIVIPYSLIRGASVIPGLLSSLAPGVANPESACFIFQNGSLQPIAMSLASQVQAVTSGIVPGGFDGISGHGQTVRPSQPSGGNGSTPQQQGHSQQQPSRGPTPNMANDNASVHSGSGGGPGSGTGEVLKAVNKRDHGGSKDPPTGSTPLDLSVRRLSPGVSVGGLGHRERSLSLSSAVSADHRMDYDSMMEGKENLSVSGDSITPEQIVCAPSLPGSPPLTPSPKRRSNSPRVGGAPGGAQATQHALGGPVGGLSISPLTLQQQLMRPLLPPEIALRLSAVGDPTVNLNLNILPNAHTLLTKQSVELALRLSSAGPPGSGPDGLVKSQISPLLNSISPTSGGPGSGGTDPRTAVLTGPTPQIFVKQGDSKCKECNIVFCKYENYLAHKKHYCSARNQDDGEPAKGSPPISPQSLAGGGVAVAGGSPAVGGGSVAYQQLICAACGIKFTSLDNLTAHQMYYCPKRIDATLPTGGTGTTAPVPSQPHKERCSKCKSMHEPGHPCTVAGHGAYKCPICEVISPNSTEARRHMDTHGGVKAFRCTICRYKGNTLRGMRTHIRMHFDKKTNEFNEENFITCILEEDGIEIPPAGAQNAAAMAAAAAAAAAHAMASSQKFPAVPEVDEASAGTAPRTPPPATSGNGNGSVVRHHCDVCPYSSSYRINVAKHMKHVHGREQIMSGNSPQAGDVTESPSYNGKADATVQIRTSPVIGTSNKAIKSEPKDDPPTVAVEDPDTPDINVDTVMDDTVIKTEAFDPHMPSLGSPLGSPTSPAQSSPAVAMNLKPKSHPSAGSPSDPLHGVIKTPSPPVPDAAGSPTTAQLLLLPGPKYCDTCDITFNYTNTYIAHKKFYCKAAIAAAAAAAGNVSGGPSSGPGRRSASASPSRATTGGATSPAVTVAVNRATETSV